VINLDKTIKELTTRLDVVHPYSASSYISNQIEMMESITGKVKR
jgi:hypothetical protein